MADFYPQQCGVRIPGEPFPRGRAGPQFCGERIRGGGFRPYSFERTDACGIPFPCTSTPRVVLQPTCYSLPTDPPGCFWSDGFARITLDDECAGVRGPIVDEENVPIPSAEEVICNPRSSFPVIPVQGG